MPPKQKTKGQREIHHDNKATLKFYLYFLAVPNVLYVLAYVFYLHPVFSIWRWLGWLIFLGSSGSCYYVMWRSAQAQFAGSQIVDAGMDLNQQGGIGEYLKDVIILTAITQLLSILTGYAFFLWLLIPGYAFYFVWVNFLWPWFHDSPAEEEAIDPKKARKMERREKRMQNRIVYR